METIKCPLCGVPLPYGATSCHLCGATFDSVSDVPEEGAEPELDVETVAQPEEPAKGEPTLAELKAQIAALEKKVAEKEEEEEETGGKSGCVITLLIIVIAVILDLAFGGFIQGFINGFIQGFNGY